MADKLKIVVCGTKLSDEQLKLKEVKRILNLSFEARIPKAEFEETIIKACKKAGCPLAIDKKSDKTEAAVTTKTKKILITKSKDKSEVKHTIVTAKDKAKFKSKKTWGDCD